VNLIHAPALVVPVQKGAAAIVFFLYAVAVFKQLGNVFVVHVVQFVLANCLNTATA